jgi:multicomponent Na+:H+ antiporter subunit A
VRALASAAIAAASFAAILAATLAGGGSVDVPWAPAWDLRLSFELDGLASLYALLATGIGFLVFAYSWRYLPLHLAHEDDAGPHRETRFYALLLLFMVSMVGLVTARDLILLFVFWDLTAVSSYFLIAYDRRRREARRSALMALLVTGVSAVLLLVGTLLLYVEYGTFQLPELVERAEPGSLLTWAAALMALAGLAKSAQVPFQFWLPRAMVAPTPVSAYLHAAAMVAAGVFLLGRLYPLLERSELVLDGLLVVGFASIAVGGVLALAQDRLKPLLAYSTVAQYGYVVALYGLGGAYGAVAGSFFVLAHALAKAALFLTAGTVTEATGEDRLSRLGGLGRALPLLAVGSGLAAAGIAALPLTIGFFRDELFFAAALDRGTGFAVLATGGAAVTFAYVGRFWLGLFLGPLRRPAGAVPLSLVLPVAVLGGLVLLGGLVVEPFAQLADDAAPRAPGAVSAEPEPAYHADARAENLMALGAYALGALLLATAAAWRPVVAAAARLGERVGPERLYVLALDGLNRLSDLIHDIEVRDLRTRIAAVLGPGGILLAIGVAATPTRGAYTVGTLVAADLVLLLALGAAALGALGTTVPRRHLTLLLLLSATGFTLAVVYAFFGAPDVALVAVLVETMVTLVFLAVLVLLPRGVLDRLASLRTSPTRRWRDPLLALFAGLGAFVVAWGALSRPSSEQSVAAEHVRLAPDAHAKDIVTAILADFRGLDTLGEITVVSVALLGIAALLRRGRLR